eukprot:951948_1
MPTCLSRFSSGDSIRTATPWRHHVTVTWRHYHMLQGRTERNLRNRVGDAKKQRVKFPKISSHSEKQHKSMLELGSIISTTTKTPEMNETQRQMRKRLNALSINLDNLSGTRPKSGMMIEKLKNTVDENARKRMVLQTFQYIAEETKQQRASRRKQNAMHDITAQEILREFSWFRRTKSDDVFPSIRPPKIQATRRLTMASIRDVTTPQQLQLLVRARLANLKHAPSTDRLHARLKCGYIEPKTPHAASVIE